MKVIRNIFAAITLLTYAGVVACAFAGHVDPEVHALPSLAVLLVPAAACVWAFLTLVWIAARCRPMIMCSLTVLAICSGEFLLFFPFGHRRSLKPGEEELKLVTYNILHGVDNEIPGMPYSRAISYIIASGADLVCIQENYYYDMAKPYACTPEQVDSLDRLYPYKLQSLYHNTMALSKAPIRELAIPHDPDGPSGCFEAFELDKSGVRILVINVHLTSYGFNAIDFARMRDGHGLRYAERKLKQAFRTRSLVAERIARYTEMYDGNVIVCGDFNDVPGSWTYRTLRHAGLRDAYCHTNTGPMATYNAHHLYFRIDHVLWRGDEIAPLSVSRGSLRASDHYPLTATFALKPNGAKN